MRWHDEERIPGVEMLFGALLRDCSAEDPRFDIGEGSRGETEEAAEVQLHPAEHVQVNHEFF